MSRNITMRNITMRNITMRNAARRNITGYYARNVYDA